MAYISDIPVVLHTLGLLSCIANEDGSWSSPLSTYPVEMMVIMDY
jgi:hypothetical protein